MQSLFIIRILGQKVGYMTAYTVYRPNTKISLKEYPIELLASKPCLSVK